ncbi:hypothetical protein [Actinophytocola sediminis]
MDPGKSKRVARDEEVFVCLGSGRPIPADLDEATRLVATLLQTLQSDVEVYRLVAITRNTQVATGYLFVRAHHVIEGGER